MLLFRSLVALAFLSLIVPAASAQKRKLKPRPPVSCEGLGKKVINNAIIRGDEYAVAVFGTCKIVVKNSRLIGKKYGALHAGTGKLELINTTVESGNVALAHTGTGMTTLRGATLIGGRASVELTGTGKIKGGKGTVFRGRKIHSGLGKLELDRSVKWEKGGAPPAAGEDASEPAEAIAEPPPGKKRPHRAIRCDRTQRFDLDNVVIQGPVAVMASGSCEIRLRNSEIVGDASAIMASGSSRIVLINTVVRSPRGLAVSISGSARFDVVGGEIRGRRAYDVSGSATVSAKNVTVRGPGSKSGSATFDDRGGVRFLRR